MAGIAGVSASGKKIKVSQMLDKINHRGPWYREIIETDVATIGVVCPVYQKNVSETLKNHHIAEDRNNQWHFAMAMVKDNTLILQRDFLGVKPLYYGFTAEGLLCFASEIKALLPETKNIFELLPGYKYDSNKGLIQAETLQKPHLLNHDAEKIAKKLYQMLLTSTEKCIETDIAGVWLSGGLDSSIIAAVLQKLVKKLHTFSIGFASSSDLENARIVADFIGSEHHEIIVSFDQVINILPDVIYHLESFDAPLIRSTIMNVIIAQMTSQFVPVVFSGECSDELFAGYEYLKKINISNLQDELMDITGKLHNTALQRVDRSASSQGLVAQVPFANPELVEYALQIPPELKIKENMEKWILRKACEGILPSKILNRTKEKFWEGSGIGEKILQYAEKQITDAEFQHEYKLKNGWQLRSKEELLYYRMFKEHFGELENLSWMGRTKQT